MNVLLNAILFLKKSIFTLYDEGDADVPAFKFNPLALLLFVIELPLPLDFFSFRPFPFDSPLF